uniref:Uncharacterized protein n=1 Tax=Trichogramma kaykai TaxID=54128 RepID=A0ABD2WRH5_9HYME
MLARYYEKEKESEREEQTWTKPVKRKSSLWQSEGKKMALACPLKSWSCQEKKEHINSCATNSGYALFFFSLHRAPKDAGCRRMSIYTGEHCAHAFILLQTESQMKVESSSSER